MHSFDNILRPLNRARFFTEFWERDFAHLEHFDPRFFNDILSPTDLDCLAASRSAKYPDIRLVKRDEEIQQSSYVYSDGRIDVERIPGMFRQGATIIFNDTQTRLAKVGRLCSSVAKALAFKCQANVYMTPPRSGGFDVHFDTHDVFVLQVLGDKDWFVYNSPLPLPLPGQDHESTGSTPGPIRWAPR